MNFTECYLTIMAGVLLADSKIHAEQKDLFEKMIFSTGLQNEYGEKFQDYLKGKKEITDEILSEIANILKKDESQLVSVVRDCYAMAAVNGHIDEKEILFIRKFLSKINQNEKAIDYMVKWSRNCQQQMDLGLSLTKRFVEG